MAISTVSFGNTPQAKDDYLLAGLTEDSTGIVCLDVMANDLGGNAKILWSLDNGISGGVGNDLARPIDLLAQDTARVESASSDTSLNGAKIWITSDGKVKYDPSTWNSTFKDQLGHLQSGQYLTDSFTYAIRLGNGTLSWATAIVQITGTNDAPTITSGAQSGSATEWVDLSADEIANTAHTAGGAVTYADVDTLDTHTASFLPQALGYVGTFLLDPVNQAGDSVSWHFSVDDSAIDSLQAAQILTQKYDVTVDDGHGGTAVQTVTITITGTNDAPTITSGAQSGSATEWADLSADEVANTAHTADGAVTYADVDTLDTHTASFLPQALGYVGTFLLDPVNQAGDSVSWHFSVDDSAIDSLQAAQVLTQKYDVTVDDGHGGTAVQTVTVTITGTNDAPTITSGAQSGSATEWVDLSADEIANTPHTADGAVTFADVDTLDTHSASFLPQAGGYLGTFSLDAVDDGADSVAWHFSVDDSAIDSLQAGQILTQKYDVTVDDGHGGTAVQTVTVTITGTNDAPILSDTTNPAAVLELGNASAQDLIAIAGDFAVSDADVGDTLSPSIVGSPVVLLDGSPFSLPAGATALTAAGAFTLTGTTSNGGSVNIGYSYNPAAADLDFLRTGQNLTITYQVQVNDGTANSNIQDVTFTITGTNDAPILSDAADPTAVLELANAAAQDLVAIAGSFQVNDLDVGDALSPSIVGSPVVQLNGGAFVLPAGASALTAAGALSLTGAISNGGSANIGYSYDPAAANLDFLKAGDSLTITYTVKVNDGTTDSGTQNVTFTITGTNDAPVADDETNSTDEDMTLTVNAAGGVLTGDVDVDGDTLSVTQFTVAGDPATYLAGATAAIAGVGSLTINADGSYSFVPALNYNGAVPVATYTVSDGSLADTGTLALSVNAVNDAPVADDETNSTDEDKTLTVNAGSGVLVGDVDVDGNALSVTQFTVAGDPATYAAGATAVIAGVGSLTINADGSYSFVPALNYNGAAPVATYTVSDGSLTDTGTLTLTVNAVNDAPVVDLNGGGGGNDATASFIEQTPVLIAPSGTVADVDSANLTSLTATLLARPDGNAVESLSLNAAALAAAAGAVPPLTVLYTAATGVLLITGSASKATYQTILEGIQYNNTSDTPTTTDRTVNVVVNDGTDSSAVHSVTISVTAVADSAPPVATDDVWIISQSTTAILPSLAVLANDTDPDGDRLRVASVTGTGVTLNVDGTIALVTGTTGGSFTYTVVDDHGGSDTGTVTYSVVNANSGFDLTGFTYDASYLDAAGGQDTLTGAGGVDVLVGGTGNNIDNLIGSSGSDILRGGQNDDVIDGGGGIDLIDFSDGNAGITFTLTQSSSFTSAGALGAQVDNDSYKNIEGVIGTNSADKLTGSGFDDVIHGGGGSDTIDGGGGNDVIYGGTGADSMTGGTGRDTFVYKDISEAGATETITGFTKGAAGDVLDLHDLLVDFAPGYDGANAFTGGYVTFNTSGADTVVKIDADGSSGAGAAVTLVTLTGVLVTSADTDNYTV